ncbi:MAG: dipeptidase [Eubacteriales bacterium]
MRLFDLHCDTASELYEKKQPLSENSLHISLKKTAPFTAYVQVAAVWSCCRLENETAWERFSQIADAFDRQLSDSPDACRVAGGEEMRAAAESGRRTFLLAVEDARILNGYISRLHALYERGVRILTLCWAGRTIIGGSHDTNAPLTPFGRAVVQRCFELGIIPDVSHASREVTGEVLSMALEAGRPVIASHSNAYAVHPHTRNLTDDEFRAIVSLRGLLGISLAPQHLCEGECTIASAAAHIRHYLSLGGEDTVCLGCDFDGIETTPAGLPDVSALPRLAEQLRAEGMSETQIDKIFFQNAYDFAMRSL